MNKQQIIQLLEKSFQELYPNESMDTLQSFIEELEELQPQIPNDGSPDWYKDAIVYSLYVDLFNKDFTGLTEKLDHLYELGVTCLWLLPILDSPMKDAGFDIKDYRKIRSELFRLPDTSSPEDYQKKFREFLDHAHNKGIKVIFDIAMNHTSIDHPWFQKAKTILIVIITSGIKILKNIKKPVCCLKECVPVIGSRMEIGISFIVSLNSNPI